MFRKCSGNLQEWCWDWYRDRYYSSSPGNNPLGDNSGASRVIRGGNVFGVRVSALAKYGPDFTEDFVGFRSVLPAGKP
jgi:formylglycine-generating enzyme required for sulfatase activity